MYFPNFEATDSEQRSGGLPGYSDTSEPVHEIRAH